MPMRWSPTNAACASRPHRCHSRMPAVSQAARSVVLLAARTADAGQGRFRREEQPNPRRQHWFLNEKSGFPFRTPAFCSVSKGQRRLGEKEYRAPSVALRVRTQGPATATHEPRSEDLRRNINCLRLHTRPSTTTSRCSPISRSTLRTARRTNGCVTRSSGRAVAPLWEDRGPDRRRRERISAAIRWQNGVTGSELEHLFEQIASG